MTKSVDNGVWDKGPNGLRSDDLWPANFIISRLHGQSNDILCPSTIAPAARR